MSKAFVAQSPFNGSRSYELSHKERSNAYRSSNSTIIAGPGTMYNEVTRPKLITTQYNDNTNTHYVTVPYSMTVKTRKTKSKTRKNKKK